MKGPRANCTLEFNKKVAVRSVQSGQRQFSRRRHKEQPEDGIDGVAPDWS